MRFIPVFHESKELKSFLDEELNLKKIAYEIKFF